MSGNDDIRAHEKLLCVQISVPSFSVARTKEDLRSTATTTEATEAGAAIVVG